MSDKWKDFQAAAKVNSKKAIDDPTGVKPGDFFQKNWAQRYVKELAYTSDKRYHYNGSARSYYEMGQSMGNAMLELISKN